VDFPEPFKPKMAIFCPEFISKLTLRKIHSLPNFFPAFVRFMVIGFCKAYFYGYKSNVFQGLLVIIFEPHRHIVLG
jgi:hypothetical protein